jgi:acetolactate synthase I/II/III large subunit
MLVERIAVPDAPAFEPVEIWPGATDMSRLQKLLWAAERPIMLLGGSRWSAAASAAAARFAERFALPVATTFRRAHLFDPYHPCYAGDLGIGPNPKLLARVKGADLILLVGGRLGEMPSQSYTLIDIPGPRQTLVHVFPGIEELGRVYAPQLAINAAPTAFAAALEGLQPPNEIKWRGETPTAHADFLAWTDKPTSVPGAVNLGEIVVALRERLPADAVITNGAGNFSVWVHRYHRYRRYGTQLAPISGSMGYGVPAAIGMKRLAPERTVVAFAGDGDFLMTGQEFATAVQYELPVIIVVVDNGMYGTIRMHQERHYPGRVVATALRNPDFAAYARAFGGYGATVEKTADFFPAFEAAQKSHKPAILHLKVDPEALTPTMSLTATREKAQAGG